MPTILGANSDTGAYEISNSLRVNEQDDAKLSFDPDGAGNVDTMTISFWMKPAVGDYGGDHNNIFSVRPSAGAYAMLVHRTGGEILFEHSGAGDILKTNRLFRDPSAWYHIVLALDSTNGTAAQRARLYVNGVEETSFAADNRANHSQNTDFLFGGGNPHQISGDPTGNYFYGGYLADFYYVNGTQLAPTSFGETNDNGVWVPIKYTGAYGTNGFHLEFKQTGTSANASGIGADTSGSGNHFTPTNLAATDITTDTPQNNFATLNPVSNFHCGATYTEGNTRFISDESKYGFNCSSIAVSSGKWYAEFKPISKDGEGGNWYMVGIAEGEQTGHRLVLGRDTGRNTSTRNGGIGWVGYATNFVYQNDAYYDGDSNAYSTAAYTEDDILGVALNADDNQVTFYKNGTVQNSGTAFVLGISETGLWHFGCGHFDTGNTFTIDANFGQPSYANSSGQSDANGYGDFEYAPPSGYYALCTKNLAEYG